MKAYDLGRFQPLVPAKRHRDWMRDTPDRFALLCLPLVIACESGWWVKTREPVSAEWTGGEAITDLTVTGGDATSHFGSGIITFHIDYLFRTLPGVQLHVRGPANMPKDGACPLEGIVETAWSPATFTMNWKLTRPGIVTWDAGEPFCQVAPIRLSDQERDIHICPLEGFDREQYDAWSKLRSRTIHAGDGTRDLHYRKGTSPGGATCPAGEHHTRIKRTPVLGSPQPAP